jgi:Xaa-Pro aminopeptidase
METPAQAGALPDGPAGPMPAGFHRRNRERLLQALAEQGGAAVVHAAPELVLGRDTDVPYRPSGDLYYLTGCEEPACVAVLSPAADGPRFTLFVRPRDPEGEAWTGSRIGVEGALERFGADEAHPIGEIHDRLPALLRGAERVFFPFGADPRLDRRMTAVVATGRRALQRSGAGPRALEDLEWLLAPLRLVKSAEEIERTRAAAEIAALAHRAAMARARPGVGEWEIEAVVDGTARAHGGGPAFPSIVGSGVNATVLHYTANDRRTRDGDLLLVDAGAQWGRYCSDVTRTFPVGGRFTPPQRRVYDIVLAAEEAGIAAARAGEPATAVHDAALRLLVDGMIRLGLLPSQDVDAAIENGGYRRYYMHQTSHWIGLDVHDVGQYRHGGAPVALEPGMLLTVEPGLYIPDAEDVPAEYRGVGVRIEDTVLVGTDRPEALTRGVPVQPEEVERLVGAEAAR